MHLPINLETAPWAGPSTPPSVAPSSPSSALSSLPKQRSQPPVTKYKKKSKREKTLSASFSLEQTLMPFSWAILWNNSPPVSWFESSGELAFTYRSHIPPPQAFTGPMSGSMLPSKVTGREGHGANYRGRNVKTVCKPWHEVAQLCLTPSPPGLNEGEWSKTLRSHFSGNRRDC